MERQVLMFFLPLFAGYLLDLAFGDPPGLPHPVRLFGMAIAKGEKILNKGRYRFLKGMLVTVCLCILVFALFYQAGTYLEKHQIYLVVAFNTVFVFYGLANKSLLDEGKGVFDALQKHGLAAGRKQLARIVGRSTENLTINEIRIAVFESLSENLSDGVIAPLFYYAIGGVPGMMTYKMINTLDSMIGYKNERYFYFGKFAARLDDIANFIPARITAFLMAAISGRARSFHYIFKYAAKHSSPNSGYPESALAGILGCRFGGPNWYHGILVDKPYIGDQPRILRHEEFRTVWYLNHAVTFIFIVLIAVLYLSLTHT
jgi:adenosylcobinamide-phosphate synthase